MSVAKAVEICKTQNSRSQNTHILNETYHCQHQLENKLHANISAAATPAISDSRVVLVQDLNCAESVICIVVQQANVALLINTRNWHSLPTKMKSNCPPARLYVFKLPRFLVPLASSKQITMLPLTCQNRCFMQLKRPSIW